MHRDPFRCISAILRGVDGKPGFMKLSLKDEIESALAPLASIARCCLLIGCFAIGIWMSSLGLKAIATQYFHTSVGFGHSAPWFPRALQGSSAILARFSLISQAMTLFILGIVYTRAGRGFPKWVRPWIFLVGSLVLESAANHLAESEGRVALVCPAARLRWLDLRQELLEAWVGAQVVKHRVPPK